MNMLNDGFLERFPVDEIYGFHNMPLLPEGLVAHDQEGGAA